jgi:hypothetical protein
MSNRSAKRASVTLIAGSEQRVIHGRMAAIMGELAAIEAEVNATPVGRIVVYYAHGQLRVENTESRPAVRWDDTLE